MLVTLNIDEQTKECDMFIDYTMVNGEHKNINIKDILGFECNLVECDTKKSFIWKIFLKAKNPVNHNNIGKFEINLYSYNLICDFIRKSGAIDELAANKKTELYINQMTIFDIDGQKHEVSLSNDSIQINSEQRQIVTSKEAFNIDLATFNLIYNMRCELEKWGKSND